MLSCPSTITNSCAVVNDKKQIDNFKQKINQNSITLYDEISFFSNLVDISLRALNELTKLPCWSSYFIMFLFFKTETDQA